jgi:biofilm PGA synthesis N-glycosyltransferase PgaC
MKILFWASLWTVSYTYIGYALMLSILARLRSRPTLGMPIAPTVSILIAARNEEQRIVPKLANLRDLNYPNNLLQIIVASDGSTDRTAALLEEQKGFVLPVILPSSMGKAVALNRCKARATGEILVFFDVRQTVHPDAVAELVSYFSDPKVGAVSGELVLNSAEKGASNGLGFYWKIEKIIRRLESDTGSVVGVTGAIYALRKELYVDLPAGTILDDVLLPMWVAHAERRVVFNPRALAYDQIFFEQGKEFSRKVRTLTGNLQLLKLAPWLLTTQNPLLFRFISHKLLRVAAPIFLLLMLIASALAQGRFYAEMFVLQLIFYGLALIGSIQPASRKWRLISLAHTFVILNLAALVALRNYVTHRTDVWG